MRSSCRAAAALAGLLAAAGLSGCPGATRASGDDATVRALPPASDDPRAEGAYRDAQAAFEAGDVAAARAGFQRFLAEFGADPLVALAHLALAQIALAEGDVGAARAHLAEVRDHPSPDVAERAAFFGGVALHLEGDAEGAVQALRPFMGRTTRPEDTLLLLTTLAAASERVGDPIGALEALDALEGAEVADEERARAREAITRLVGEARPEVVDRAADVLPPPGLAWRLSTKRAARLAYEAGRADRARALLASLEGRGALDDELRDLALRTSLRPDADPAVVGAILPLSGRGREVGQRALRGLLLASGGPGAAPADAAAPRLVLRDDGGDPARAARALDELVTVHRAIAVIGPLDAASAAAVARRAEALGTPVLSLAPGARLGEPTTFELFPRPEDETRALLEASVARGQRRVAILRPEHAYGAAFGRAVREGAGAVGATVVSEVLYAPGEHDLRSAVRALRESPAFDALVLPDAPDRVAVLVPALAAALGRRALPRLLLPSTAWRADLVEDDPRLFEGALVSLPYRAAAAPGDPFADAHRARFGEAPGVFEALAYDAYRLVRAAVDEGGSTRAALTEALGRVRLERPVGPAAGLDPRTRRLARPTRVYLVREGTLVPLAPDGDQLASR